MFIIIWQYTVSFDKLDKFLTAYKSEGQWSQFFKQSDSYISSKLYKSSYSNYIVIDSWKSRDAYHAFKRKFSIEYQTLSADCSTLYDDEKKLGEYEEIG